jgi:hypothetical protein
MYKYSPEIKTQSLHPTSHMKINLLNSIHHIALRILIFDIAFTRTNFTREHCFKMSDTESVLEGDELSNRVRTYQ